MLCRVVNGNHGHWWYLGDLAAGSRIPGSLYRVSSLTGIRIGSRTLRTIKLACTLEMDYDQAIGILRPNRRYGHSLPLLTVFEGQLPMTSHRPLRLLSGLALIFASVLIPWSTLRAQGGDGGSSFRSFSGIVAFGDSLSDTGNFFALTGFPPEPYYQGRISNGIVWVEYLKNSLKVGDEQFSNYAFAGATTGRDNENDFPGVFEFPGLQDEIDLFQLGLAGEPADPEALYIVWAGANDFFVYGANQQTVIDGVSNTLLAVQRLHGAGARHIMVVNLPDLGLTPFGRSVDPIGLSFISEVYNQTLDSALDGLAASGVPTIRVDTAGALRELVTMPQRYRFSNVTDNFLQTGGNPDRFLFWDNVHPTTRGHKFIADEALQSLRRRVPYR